MQPILGQRACRACQINRPLLPTQPGQPGRSSRNMHCLRSWYTRGRPSTTSTTASATSSRPQTDPTKKHFWTKDESLLLMARCVCRHRMDHIHMTSVMRMHEIHSRSKLLRLSSCPAGVSGHWQQQWDGMVLRQDSCREWCSCHHGCAQPGADPEGCRDDKGLPSLCCSGQCFALLVNALL